MSDNPQQVFTVLNGKDNRPAIALNGFIGGWRINSEVFYTAIARLEKEKVTDCDLIINSGGGSVVDGFTIGEAMEASSIKFHGVVVGMAASMAGVILQFCDTRKAYKYARVMTHKAKGRISGEAEQIRNYADFVDQEETKIVNKFVERTGKDKKAVAKWMKSGIDLWMNSETAKANNLIDEIVNHGKKVSNDTTDEKDLVNSYNENYSMAVAAYTPHEPNNENKSMNNLLVAALGKAGLVEASSNPTDEQVAGIVNDLISRTDKAETELKNFKQEQAEVLIANALKAGKIGAKEKEQLIEDAVQNYALVSKMLERMSGTPDLNNGLERQLPEDKDKDDNQPEIMNGREKWTFADWQEKDSKGLKNLEEDHKEIFEKLFNEAFLN